MLRRKGIEQLLINFNCLKLIIEFLHKTMIANFWRLEVSLYSIFERKNCMFTLKNTIKTVIHM